MNKVAVMFLTVVSSWGTDMTQLCETKTLIEHFRMLLYIFYKRKFKGACGSIVVKAICHKLKGRGSTHDGVNEFFQFAISFLLY
jgi:hypothetical protein